MPAADYIHADLTTVEFARERSRRRGVLLRLQPRPARVARAAVRADPHLASPGGLLLATLGASDLPGWTGDFLGAPSYFSGYPAATNRRLLADAGFTLLRDELVTIREPEADATFHWVLGHA